MPLFRGNFSLIRSFAILWVAHFFIDFFVGIWPIYKTLAGIDVLLAGVVMGVAGFTGELSQVFFGYFSDRGFRRAILIAGVLLYRNEFKNWIFGCAKATQFVDHKCPNINNMRAFMIDELRQLSC